MTPYSQRDTKWGNVKLGYGNTLIKTYGCTITALGSLLDTQPNITNEKLKANNGFTTYGNKNLIIWAAIPKAFSQVESVYRYYTYNNTKVVQAIKDNGGCLVEVDAAPIGSPRTSHWVLFIGNKQCMDPWVGQIVPTSKFPILLGYAVIKTKKAVPPVITPNPDALTECLRDYGELKEKVNKELLPTIDSLRIERDEIRRENDTYKEQQKKIADQLDCENQFPIIIGKIEGLLKKEDDLVKVQDENLELQDTITENYVEEVKTTVFPPEEEEKKGTVKPPAISIPSNPSESFLKAFLRFIGIRK